MNERQTDVFRGNIIEIYELILKYVDNKLDMSWKICLDKSFLQMTFYNVSQFRIGEVSAPLEIHGFEIINHFQNGWEKDSGYEIRDFEDNRVNFFCEHFKLHE